MKLRNFALVGLVGVAGAALAQQPAATPIAPPACTKPGEHPGRLASDTRRNAWTRAANTYLECMKKFIQEQQAAYNKVAEQAKPHLDAANAAIDEYNKSVAEFKTSQEQ